MGFGLMGSFSLSFTARLYRRFIVFSDGELIVLCFVLFLVADMGIRLWWRTPRGDGGILFSTRYGQFLVLEYEILETECGSTV